jgi:hypothetical protein
MLAAGLLIRLPALSRPPMESHPTRQYHGAKIIRGMYLGLTKDSPRWEEWQVRLIAEDTPDFIEPPLLEFVSAVGWRLAGRELLWLPRLISALMWTLAGLALYSIARSFLAAPGAFAALGAYLFAPYGVIVSRSIQPDPTMVALLLFSLWAILRYVHAPSRKHYVAAVVVTALAIFIKPVMAAFVAFMVYGLLRLHREGLRSSLRSPANWLFPVLAMLPAAIYFFAGMGEGGAMEGQVSSKIMPHLWRNGAYWAGWLGNINEVVGLRICFLAVVGSMLIRHEEGRIFSIAYWAGYGVYGLVFSYHIFTHDYYHLQIIPMVAIGLGVWAEMFGDRLARMKRPKWLVPALVLAGVAGIAVLCLKPLRWHYAHAGYEESVRLAEEIGAKVGHSPRTLFLAPDYGKPLTFHGWFGGQAWPQGPGLRLERLRGEPSQTVPERIAALSAKLEGRPEFFVVTDLDEIKTQTALAQYLKTSCPEIAHADDYIIYRMTAPEPGAANEEGG